MDGNCVQIGESVECGDDDDPKQLTCTRIKDIETDTRTARVRHFFGFDACVAFKIVEY